MIITENLTKRFDKLTAVDNLSLNIGSGELFGFLGPNGAGKTTTINMLTGLLQPTSGTATICGFDIQKQPLQAKAVTGLLPDTPHLYETLTGRQFVRFIADLYEIEPKRSEGRMDELFELFDLTESVDDLIRGYSHGMKKKLLLTSVIVQEPKVMFLDEPTSGLDPKSARTAKEILKALCDRGCTVFMTTHILEVAEGMCDRIGIINKGQLIAVGTMEELRRSEGVNGLSLEDIFLDLTGGIEYEEMARFLEAG
ncbi:TPA: ABC transporter ATP-binding protein [Candidatus Poribacteria bacterium]|nr:ABC transporter ATP-binding protein [Candidatus Poribacteria bacterium]